jgi:hypothetical protein
MGAKASFACLRLQLVGKGGSQDSERHTVREEERWKCTKAYYRCLECFVVLTKFANP